MRIAIMGAGGIGSCYGGLLARAGNDVTLIARGAHLQALKQNGLQLNCPDESFTVQVPATDDPSEIGPVDLVLFTVKTNQNSDAIPVMKPLIGNDTTVLTLQNGVESAGEIGQDYGVDRVLPGAAYIVAYVVSPGEVTQHNPEVRIAFGESGGALSPRAISIRDTLSEASITADLSDDIAKVIWSKFLFNAPVNAMASAARTPPRQLMETPEGSASFRTAMQEVANIGQAKGVHLGEAAIDNAMDFIGTVSITARGSMLTDLDAGRPLELEATVGSVCRIGRQVNVPTPINNLLYALLLPYKDGPPGES
jgi:2-dehydropantoate 2-reductase